MELLKTATGVKISKIPLSAEEKAEIKKNIAAKELVGEFILFGNIKTSQYEIFEKAPRTVKPKSMVQVVAHPLNERLINVKVADGANVIRAILMCLAVGMLE